MPTITKRKLKSYKRAERVCRELRHHLTNPRTSDGAKIGDLMLSWMSVTGNIKYERP